ncbi:MAG: 3-phosphoserine/phosphohydroxythreonine transaminase [Myxococcota bacterium]|nr:3-phosphoserine/phosphohydroxythreonine transaminase [Myxococcota bacterium]
MVREHNFSAGPAALPVEVLQQLQEPLIEFSNANAGIMEISHRGPAFAQVIHDAEERIRRLMGIPQDYKVLFLQGGASLQFYMLALNLLHPNEEAEYLVSGAWSKKALIEAKRVSLGCSSIWDDKEKGYTKVPKDEDYQANPDAVYQHYTTNNTIYGTQFHHTPKASKANLVADMSSDICSRPVEVSKHALIYAGAQKNLGPSGVTLVILAPWVLEKSKAVASKREMGLPSMLDYALQVDKGSMFNTPNTFGIYALERVLAWQEAQGGLETLGQHNKAKADKLYAMLDESDFWRPHAETGSRSLMNITWKNRDESLESRFLAEATQEGLHALKGHRSVGGIRASLYNACPNESVEALLQFMNDFEKRCG